MSFLFDKIRFYGVFGTFRLARDLVLTRIFFKRARIVRWPFFIRNRGSISLGKNITTGVGLRIDCIDATSTLIIGDSVQVNDYCHIGVKGKIEIGNNVLIASRVMIIDHNHGNISYPCNSSSPNTPPIDRPLEHRNVTISDNVWIGEGASILPGVCIGTGSIIGAGAVVTTDIPEYTIAVGNPARSVKVYDFEQNSWNSIASARPK